MAEGAKNVVKLLDGRKTQDLKALAEVGCCGLLPGLCQTGCPQVAVGK